MRADSFLHCSICGWRVTPPRPARRLATHMETHIAEPHSTLRLIVLNGSATRVGWRSLRYETIVRLAGFEGIDGYSVRGRYATSREVYVVRPGETMYVRSGLSLIVEPHAHS